MDFTTSSNNQVHQGTSRRMHSSAVAPTTRVTAKDMNGLTWEVVEAITASGQTPEEFDPDVPVTYRQLTQAIRILSSQMFTTKTLDVIDGNLDAPAITVIDQVIDPNTALPYASNVLDGGTV